MEFKLFPHTPPSPVGWAVQFKGSAYEDLNDFLKEAGNFDQFNLERSRSEFLVYDNERSECFLLKDGYWVVHFSDENRIEVYDDFDELKEDFRLELS